MASQSPRVFISYSHDSPEHDKNVLNLAKRLRSDGFTVVIDQELKWAPKGWTVWMDEQIEQADFVLMICTETYKRRAEGKEDAPKGPGASWEGAIIRLDLYEANGRNDKFIPILLRNEDKIHRPKFLRDYSYFLVSDDARYRDLRQLMNPEDVASAKPTRTWNIPARNDYFSGRDGYLDRLHKALSDAGAAALTQAIKGLGGIGKTQTAVEYAHRYRGDYAAGFWMTADSRDALVSGFAGLASLLGLPVDQDLGKTAEAVKHWFESNSGWLLILDNVESMNEVKDWIPAEHRGHVVITTRMHSTGTVARGLDLAKMTADEGADFLLRRAKIENPSHADRTAARDLSKQMGGLPLALDQAGAYIEEAQVSASEYLKLYQREGKKLRARSGVTPDHDSVTRTFSLAVERLGERAKDIVCICAFMAPDAIPEEILTGGEEPDLAFREAVAEAAKYSLISRSAAERTIEIHRLVQEVVRDGLDEPRVWAERILDAVNLVFPSPVFANWPQCERLLPQAKAAAQLIKEYGIESRRASRLLNEAAYFLGERAQYSEAEPLYQRALAIHEKVLWPDHLDTAISLNNLAKIYDHQRRYEEAELLYQRALAIQEKVLGPEHHGMAPSLNNLALHYHDQRRFSEAEPLAQRALAIRENVLRPNHPDVAISLNNLAAFYHDQRRYGEAEPLLQRALAIREKALMPGDPDLAMSLPPAKIEFPHGNR